MDTTVIIALVAFVIILIVLYMQFFANKKEISVNDGGIGSLWTAGTGVGVKAGTKKPDTWTVYGSDGCGWTLKQLAVFESKGIPYNYVNCDKNPSACKGTSAFPTLVSPEGVQTVGFNGLE